MKNLIIIFTLFLFSNSYSQQLFLNHQDKEFSLGVKYARGLKGEALHLVGDYIQSNTFGYNSELTFERNILNVFEYTDFTHLRLGGGVFYNPLKYAKNNTFFLHLKAGASIGFETISSKVEDKTEVVFVFGPKVGVNVEVYIFPKTIMFLGIDQYYLYQSKVGNWHWEAFVGLKRTF